MSEEAGHYCTIHDTTFFKKGKMKGYAHPIKDENGKDTGLWCNEKEEEEKPKEYKKADYKSDRFKADPAKQASIELQHYTSEVRELWVAGKFKDDSPRVKRYLEILDEKIGMPISKGGAPVKPPVIIPPVPKVSKETMELLFEAQANAVVTNAQLQAEVAKRGWTAKNRGELTQDQAEVLLGWLQEK